MTRYRADAPTGIVAFRHADAAQLAADLLRENTHVMYHAGRIRIAIHGYNTREDVDHLLRQLAVGLRQTAA
jgi:selenocysteine lyase/cysteine desulfurase